MAKARIVITYSNGTQFKAYDTVEKIDESYIISTLNKFKTDDKYIILNEFDRGKLFAVLVVTEYIVHVTVEIWEP